MLEAQKSPRAELGPVTSQCPDKISFKKKTNNRER